MIFGFNTDVKHGNTVYHVQSEAHPSTHTLQSTVFVQGRCLGKTSSSYASQVTLADFSEEKMHELLKEQHLFVVDAIQEGKLEVALQNTSLSSVGCPQLLSISYPISDLANENTDQRSG